MVQFSSDGPVIRWSEDDYEGQQIPFSKSVRSCIPGIKQPPFRTALSRFGGKLLGIRLRTLFLYSSALEEKGALPHLGARMIGRNIENNGRILQQHVRSATSAIHGAAGAVREVVFASEQRRQEPRIHHSRATLYSKSPKK